MMLFYENNDYNRKRRETCQTWNTEDFRSDNPVTGRAVIFEMFHAILDLRRLAYERILQPVSPDEELQPVSPDDVAYRMLLRGSSEKLFGLYHERAIGHQTTSGAPTHKSRAIPS